MEGGQAIPLLDHVAEFHKPLSFSEVLAKVLVFLPLLVTSLPAPNISSVSQLMLGEGRVPLARRNPPGFPFLASC